MTPMTVYETRQIGDTHVAVTATKRVEGQTIPEWTGSAISRVGESEAQQRAEGRMSTRIRRSQLIARRLAATGWAGPNLDVGKVLVDGYTGVRAGHLIWVFTAQGEWACVYRSSGYQASSFEKLVDRVRRDH